MNIKNKTGGTTGSTVDKNGIIHRKGTAKTKASQSNDFQGPLESEELKSANVSILGWNNGMSFDHQAVEDGLDKVFESVSPEDRRKYFEYTFGSINRSPDLSYNHGQEFFETLDNLNIPYTRPITADKAIEEYNEIIKPDSTKLEKLDQDIELWRHARNYKVVDGNLGELLKLKFIVERPDRFRESIIEEIVDTEDATEKQLHYLIYNSDDPYDRQQIARHKNLTSYQMREILEKDETYSNNQIAGNPNAIHSVLSQVYEIEKYSGRFGRSTSSIMTLENLVNHKNTPVEVIADIAKLPKKPHKGINTEFNDVIDKANVRLESSIN